MQEARPRWNRSILHHCTEGLAEAASQRGACEGWEFLGGLVPPGHVESSVLCPGAGWICLGFVSSRVSGLLHHRHTEVWERGVRLVTHKAQLLLPFPAVVATPGGFQGLREKGTIVLKSLNQLKEAEGGFCRACAEVPKEFVQSLLKYANSPQPGLCLTEAAGTHRNGSLEWLVALCVVFRGGCGLRAVALGDTGVPLGLCAAHGQALPVWAEHISWCGTDSDHACFSFRALLEGLWSLVLALLLPSVYP